MSKIGSTVTDGVKVGEVGRIGKVGTFGICAARKVMDSRNSAGEAMCERHHRPAVRRPVKRS